MTDIQDVLAAASSRFNFRRMTTEEGEAAQKARFVRWVEEAEKERHEHLYRQKKAWKAPEWWTIENFDRNRWPAMGQMMDALIHGGEYRSILATAPTDSGKSHAMVAIARAYVEHKTRIEKCEEQVLCVQATAYRIREHDLYPLWDISRYRRSERFEEIIESARNADVLIYDDLGKVELTRGDFALTPFGCVIFSIFDYRAEMRKINLVTSRYDSLDKLQGAVGVDLVRRIVQMERGELLGRIVTK